MSDLPADAITAAAKTIADELVTVQARFMTYIEFGEYLARTALDAAAPLIAAQAAASERERLVSWLDTEGCRLRQLVDDADAHGPAARRAVQNHRKFAEACFNAATLLRAGRPEGHHDA